ncbi:MAG TPA: alpha/beta fold hydrolase [Acidimicrobiales bacterium]|jgi:pimeloyl-ACP methyl ester carboxylesterase|nr:alpha/beta fold hydrolase [Acidimicrobiales bacterium]
MTTDLDVSVTGEGRTVIWTHGLTSSRAGEDEARMFPWPDLGVARWVRYDARGHGRSSAPTSDDDCRWDRLATDLFAVADAVGADRFIAGGASMGCATSLHAVYQHPERIDGLLLVIPPTAWGTRRAQVDQYLHGAALLDAGDIDGYLASLDEALLPPMFAEWADQVRQARREQLADADLPSLARVLRAAGASDLPPLEAFQRVAVPTLILAWAGDPGHPVSTAEALAGTIPHAELFVADTVTDVFAWRDRVAAWLATVD